MKGAYFKNCEADWRGKKIMTSVSGGIKIMSKKVLSYCTDKETEEK